jgi:signal transduction histidine kinase/DNA-binding response OmpR family regulator
LFEDNKRNIWFCTESGLCYLDAVSRKIIRYTGVPELRDNQVFKVLQDDSGVLWISTSRGLISLDPVTGQAKVFGNENGLLSDQFNYNSAFKDRNGRLYFGTVKGMISFNPSSLVENKIVPPVYITGIQINNQDPDLTDPGSPLRQTIQYSKKITLPYNSSNITIEAAALSYSMPALNAYTYKMEGLDKDWTTIETNRKIYYTKLQPGHYTFKIKGSNGDKLWNNHVTQLNIRVLPPWWGSWWAYIIYAMAILGIGFIIFRYYYLAMTEKSQRLIKTLEIEKEREVYNAKIEFFTNVTHEIRTPLTLIKLPIEKLLKSSSKDAKLHEHLTMIEKNTNRLIHLTNQLLDFRKAEANNYTLNFVRTDINDLLRQLFVTYKPIAEEKKLSFRLEIPRITLLAYVDAEALRKIIGNLLSNAIKYADHSISVKLLPFNSDDNLFHIEFRNDGFIIPYELKDKIFEPFFRLKETEKMAGTGIGLPLSRSLAELHKGTLELKHPTGNNNLFLLSIPVHQETEIDLNEYETIESSGAAEEDEDVSYEGAMHESSILIVEDNKEITRFLEKELHSTYNIFSATDGQEALQILSDQHIDLVISDIMMPVMDGIELSKSIKTNIEYSHIPIILLTARNTITSKIEGLESGADAYIEKPFVMEHLIAQISSLLSNRNHIKEYYAHSPLAHIRGVACTKADTSFLEDLQKVIDENIIDKDLDVDMLSRMMNMSRSSFYRKIKGLINLTPNELICISRLKIAAELLAKGNYKINEVANMVGYDQTSNFSRDFNKQFGVTPSHYVNNIAGNN